MTNTERNQLIFKFGNAKLDPFIAHMSLPAAYSCPGALFCKSQANRKTGKIKDGKHCQFRCWEASLEANYPNYRNQVWHNFDILKGKSYHDLVEIINEDLPKNAPVVRANLGGDFFSQEYFDAWLEVARRNPKAIFYCYTKSLEFWAARLGQIPKNFKLNASKGGKFDYLIDKHDLKYAEVVYSPEEAAEKELEFDHQDGDSLAYQQDKSFALLLHGTQPAGSEASKAWAKIKKEIGGYSKKKARKK